jgi:hypothetical protein
MPDPVNLVVAPCISATVAALVLLLCERRWTEFGWILGVTGAFYVACVILGLRPHWPPREDQDRLLLIVLPAVVATELVGAIARVPRGIVNSLRLIVVGGTARVLLDGTRYVSHAAGPDSRIWSAAELWLALAALALALAAVWWALAVLSRRAADFSLPLCLAIACGGAGLTVVLSGYLSGGLLGLPLAAALVGATLAVPALSKPLGLGGLVGLCTVMIFGLLIIGRFFGELTTNHACVLFAAPLAAWLPQLLPQTTSDRLRGWLRVLTVSVVVGAVIVSAVMKFDAGPPALRGEPDAGVDIQDYYK